jgi:hypothetical protein
MAGKKNVNTILSHLGLMNAATAVARCGTAVEVERADDRVLRLPRFILRKVTDNDVPPQPVFAA